MNFLNHYLIDILNAIDGIANLVFIVLLVILPCCYFSYIRDSGDLLFLGEQKWSGF